ncbi:hypothetical protein OHB14_12170 [Streptomyces sp. NBC_01613]
MFREAGRSGRSGCQNPGAHLTLLGRVGGERAAYAMVLFPIVVLLLSAD